jgi:hypothetical protein
LRFFDKESPVPAGFPHDAGDEKALKRRNRRRYDRAKPAGLKRRSKRQQTPRTRIHTALDRHFLVSACGRVQASAGNVAQS